MTQLEIEAFLAVAKYNTLSAAAQKLFISQPALTRRIQTMEQEVGCALFVRQKGKREIRLTPRGVKFYHVLQKWQRLQAEMHALRNAKEREYLSIAATDSVLHNILPRLLVEFSRQGYLLELNNAFSETAFQFMEKGLYDLAFIATQDYTQPQPSGTQIHPAYSEVFVVVSFGELPNRDGKVTVDSLDGEKEVLLRWNKEFMAWHRTHFDESVDPVVILEYFSLAPYFLTGDAWMFTPYVTGLHFQQQGAHLYDVVDGPPNQIIHYLTNDGPKEMAIQQFLAMLDAHLRTMPADKVKSFLEHPLAEDGNIL